MENKNSKKLSDLKIQFEASLNMIESKLAENLIDRSRFDNFKQNIEDLKKDIDETEKTLNEIRSIIE